MAFFTTVTYGRVQISLEIWGKRGRSAARGSLWILPKKICPGLQDFLVRSVVLQEKDRTGPASRPGIGKAGYLINGTGMADISGTSGFL